MNDRNETLASNLRDLRSWNKLTLEQVAERIGVTRQAVAKWESGERAPDLNNCAALAEVVAGAAVGCQDMVLITLGTGVGSGIISRGKILSGLRGGAGEAGHMLLVLDGEPCTCGRRGCWEAYASATALIRQTRQEALAHPESLLAQAREITGRTAFDAAQQGDATAAEVVARYAVYVAAGLTDFVNILAPEMILLGGGISRQGEALLAPVREYVATHCFGQREGAIPIIAAAKLGNEAGIIGAAAL